MELLTQPLIALFERDLENLKNELNEYRNEADLWKIKGAISNSGGNLTLHVIGNLRHFIGNVLGGTDYVRDRKAEFESKNIPVEKLIEQIQLAKLEVSTTLKKLTQEDLEKKFPIDVLRFEMTTAYFLTHLYGHLNYHLGQVNYHRRLA